MRMGIAMLLMAAAAPVLAGDWPQWRGPDRTGWAPADTRALAKLPAEPKAIWRLDIGGGFSSPVVAGGKLVYLDAQNNKEVAHLIDAATGKEIWKTPFADEFGDEWGSGPRSTPIMDGERVFVQSCNGEFRCLNAADGKTIWGTSFTKDFGAVFLGNRAPDGAALRRGNNGAGVLDGERIILTAGGTQGAGLVCFDKRTGKVIWKAGNDEAGYSSPMIATLAGMKQVVAFTADALMGVELDSGKILWRVPIRSNAKRHAMTPIIVGDTVTVSSWTVGLTCYKISKNGDAQKADELWTNPSLKISVASPIVADGALFCEGVQRDYLCLDATTGKQRWRQPGFGEMVAPTIGIGKDLLALTDKGELVLMAASTDKYTEKGRVQVCGKTWSHPALADGKLFVREGVDRGWKLTCFDLSAPIVSGN